MREFPANGASLDWYLYGFPPSSQTGIPVRGENNTSPLRTPPPAAEIPGGAPLERATDGPARLLSPSGGLATRSPESHRHHRDSIRENGPGTRSSGVRPHHAATHGSRSPKGLWSHVGDGGMWQLPSGSALGPDASAALHYTRLPREL